MSVVTLSKREAAALLGQYHFAPAPFAQVVTRLGSVQYDPLNPLGRNPDLVLQARVPGYQRDDWHAPVYAQRLLYDAWDKQACLCLPRDWRYRRLYHAQRREQWHARVFKPYPDAVNATLNEIKARGALSSLEFEDVARPEGLAGSWYGPRLIKHVLRALWDSGELVTSYRVKGRHVYDLPERVIPSEHLNAPAVSKADSVDYLILRRHQTTGLLRANADSALWSLPVKAAERRERLQALVDDGRLQRVLIEGTPYHCLPDFLNQTLTEDVAERMVFVAPLDSLIWDRKGVKDLFNFDYIWEVYKPETARLWGYYVLPVFYRNRFVARFDSRLIGDTWHVYRWWWEDDDTPDTNTLNALENAVRAFMHYLKANKLKLPRGMDKAQKDAMRAGATP